MTDDGARSTPDPAATPSDQPTDQSADRPQDPSDVRSAGPPQEPPAERSGGRLNRRQVLTGSGLAALGLAGAAAGGHSVGSRDRGGPPPRPDRAEVHVEGGNGMNVVVIVLDTVRRDDLGAYGGTTSTPNLDAFAASATRFTRAYPEMLPTIPVRRAVHTGQRTYPARDWERPVSGGLPGWQRIPESQSTLAEVLQSAGYTTAMLADTPHLYSPSMNFSRGFDAYQWKRGQKYDRFQLAGGVSDEVAGRYLLDWVKGQRNERVIRATLRTLERPEDEQPVARVFADGADLLGELADAQPFMLMLDTFEPHEPWIMPSRYLEEYDEVRFDEPEPTMPRYGSWEGQMSERQLERMTALYAANLTFTDRWVGHFMDALNQRGLQDTTLVCVVSDHGIMLGEHGGIVGKPSALPYPEVTDLMLLMRHPERGHGTTDDRLAAHHDIPASIVAALGVTTDKALDGSDLLSAGAGRSYATSLYAKTIWVRDERWLLIGDEYAATTLLFDLTADDGLEHDVSDAHPGVVEELLDLARRDAGGEIPHYPDAGTL